MITTIATRSTRHADTDLTSYLDARVDILGIKRLSALKPDAQHPSVRARGTFDLQLERRESR
jgi:hypothetical protein